MVKHRLTVEEAKAMMMTDPERANRMIQYAGIFLTIIAAVIVAFIYLVMG